MYRSKIYLLLFTCFTFFAVHASSHVRYTDQEDRGFREVADNLYRSMSSSRYLGNMIVNNYRAEYKIIDAQFNNGIATENTFYQLYQLIDKVMRDPQVDSELKNDFLAVLGRNALISAARYGSQEARDVMHRHIIQNDGGWRFNVQANGDLGEATIALVITKNQCRIAQIVGVSILAVAIVAGIATWNNKKRPSKSVPVAKCAVIAGAIAAVATAAFCYRNEIAGYFFGPIEPGWLGLFEEDMVRFNLDLGNHIKGLGRVG